MLGIGRVVSLARRDSLYKLPMLRKQAMHITRSATEGTTSLQSVKAMSPQVYWARLRLPCRRGGVISKAFNARGDSSLRASTRRVCLS